MNIQELVAKLKLQNIQKRDMVVPAQNMSFQNGKLIVAGLEKEDSINQLLKGTGIATIGERHSVEFAGLPFFHGQVSTRLEIPKGYYDRMQQSHPLLLDQNVNYWFQQNAGKNYLIRTFVNDSDNTGVVRTLLSDSYNVMDNYDVLFACMKAIGETGLKLDIESADITDRKMYVRFTCPEIELQAPDLLRNYRVPNGSPLQGNTGIISGFVISNSEIGAGTFKIQPRMKILACSNGMIREQDTFKKLHLGKKMEAYSTINWSQETRNKNYELIMSQCRDAVKTIISKDYLGNWINELTNAGETKLQHPVDAVKNVIRYADLGEQDEKQILDYFVRGGDTRAFGISQALTYFAHTDAQPDVRQDLEIISGQILPKIATFDRPFVEKVKNRYVDANMN